MDFNKCVFKFLDIGDSYFMENLRNNELVTKYFDDFNDPYDSHYGIDAIWPHIEKENGKLKRLIKSLEPENYQEITKSKNSIIQYINSNADLTSYTSKRISSVLPQFRVCCFSRVWNHILMWSHYANGCRGLALIFDQEKISKDSKSRLVTSNKELTGITGRLYWVNYEYKPPILNAVEVFESVRIGTDEALNNISLKMLETCALTKYKKWSYEQESRLICRYEDGIEKERVLYKYRIDALKGAIIGHKSDPEKITEITKLLPEDSIIYFTNAANDRYKLKINQTFTARQIASGKVKLGKEVG